MKTPTPNQHARARALVSKLNDAEVIALTGNWRPLKPPPLLEFVRRCLIVAKETGTLIPFELWPAQQEALEVIEKAEKLIIPKGRQVGITWLELAFMLWAGTFWGNRTFPIARQSDPYAREAIVRLLTLAGYEASSEPGRLRLLPESPLPEAWRAKIVRKTKRDLLFANGSSYRAMTATQPLARGMASYHGLADEYAFWPWPTEQLAAMESGCGRIHIVSTGNGDDDAFAALYANAAAGRGAYKTLFIPSDADPRRDEEWYRLNVEEAADPDGARREHARSVQDAFRSPEGAFFKRFSFERHVKEIAIVANWHTWRAVDFGFNYSACLWAQSSPSGQLFIIDELLPTDTATPEFVEQIKAREATFGLVEEPRYSCCDPAGKGINTQTAQTEFELFARQGLRPVGKSSAIRDGCVRIMDLLADKERPLVVAARCKGLVRALSQVKPHRINHKIYQDHEIFSHPLDALRYLLINVVPDREDERVYWNADEPSPVETREQAGYRTLMGHF